MTSELYPTVDCPINSTQLNSTPRLAYGLQFVYCPKTGHFPWPITIYRHAHSSLHNVAMMCLQVPLSGTNNSSTQLDTGCKRQRSTWLVACCAVPDVSHCSVALRWSIIMQRTENRLQRNIRLCPRKRLTTSSTTKVSDSFITVINNFANVHNSRLFDELYSIIIITIIIIIIIIKCFC